MREVVCGANEGEGVLANGEADRDRWGCATKDGEGGVLKPGASGVQGAFATRVINGGCRFGTGRCGVVVKTCDPFWFESVHELGLDEAAFPQDGGGALCLRSRDAITETPRMPMTIASETATEMCSQGSTIILAPTKISTAAKPTLI